MSVDFKLFEDFLSLARHCNFSRASEERCITQSAFSRRIKTLELWVGVPLVDRSVYPTKLTPEGENMIKRAQEILSLVNSVKSEFREMKVKGENTIQFTSLHTTALAFFPEWLSSIESDIGPLNIRMEADSMHNCVQNMMEFGYDFYISFIHPSEPIILDSHSYSSLIIGKDQLVPISVPLENGKPKFTLFDTGKKIPILTYPENAYFARLLSLLLDGYKKEYEFEECYVNSFADAIRSMAIKGKGIAWLPKSIVEDDLAFGRLVMVESKKKNYIDLDVCIYRNISSTRPQVERLWDYLLTRYS